MKVDPTLREEDQVRRDNAAELFNILSERKLPDWPGFSHGAATILVHENERNAQLHVGYVFTLTPHLALLHKHRTRIVAVSSPALNEAFSGWEETIRVVPGNLPPHAMLRELDSAGVDCHVRHRVFHENIGDLRRNGLSQQNPDQLYKNPTLLQSHPALTKRLRELYSEKEQKRVLGLIWRTGGVRKNKERNALLEDFAPIFLLDGYNVVSLQYGNMETTRNEVNAFNGRYRGMSIFFDDKIDPMKDYVGAGAQMAACDVVVGVDCSQVLQSSAYGVHTHTILRPDPPQHWGETSSGICPYFPGINTLHARPESGNWAPAILDIREQIIGRNQHTPPWSNAGAERIKTMHPNLRLA